MRPAYVSLFVQGMQVESPCELAGQMAAVVCETRHGAGLSATLRRKKRRSISATMEGLATLESPCEELEKSSFKMESPEDEAAVQDGGRQQTTSPVAPPGGRGPEAKFKKRKTRRGKSKRTLMLRPQWRRRQGRKDDKPETHAPYNNNQFLMEEHVPAEQDFLLPRTRDSSFSVDSDDNYFYPLPEDEEDFLTKEFSSVYEDAQSERLMSMSKADLMQEYLSLKSRCEELTKRIRQDASPASDALGKIKEQEEIIRELRSANQSLKVQLEQTQRPRSSSSSSVDSESDSSSSSCSDASRDEDGDAPMTNGYHASPERPLVNGHRYNDRPNGDDG